MLTLYNEISYKHAELITKKYSTSFSIGILFLDKSIRKHIYAIYGLVRLADEIVDTMFHISQKEWLKSLQEETSLALKSKFSTNTVLNAFQLTANKFGIDEELINPFFDSMNMDLYKREYDGISYKKYIYGSAEVVGLMCLKVFTNGDKTLFDRLKSYAQALGSAFQKVNFLRDIKNDYELLNRTYFPGIDFKNLSEEAKASIIKDIETDFYNALDGIKMLPPNAKLGVMIAYEYYIALLKKIKKLPSNELLKKRIRINNFIKLLIALKVIIKSKFKKF